MVRCTFVPPLTTSISSCTVHCTAFAFFLYPNAFLCLFFHYAMDLLLRWTLLDWFFTIPADTTPPVPLPLPFAFPYLFSPPTPLPYLGLRYYVTHHTAHFTCRVGLRAASAPDAYSLPPTVPHHATPLCPHLPPYCHYAALPPSPTAACVPRSLATAAPHAHRLPPLRRSHACTPANV